MLLNYNANPDLQTRDGYTALMLTASSTRAWPEVADALLKAGANPNVRGKCSIQYLTLIESQTINDI